MLIARFSAGDVVKYGLVEGTTVRGLKYSPFSPLGATFETDGSSYRLDDIKLLAPSAPTKLVCLGLNYHAHAAETHAELPKVPLMFLKPSSAIIGPGDEIVLPTNDRIDHEAELAIVIGRKAKDVPEAEVKDYILGYTCVNDVSEREIQKSDVQWTRAKGFDTFAPMGPWIATGINADDLKIEALVNGQAHGTAAERNQ